jgi:hypothetical protein
MWWIIGIFAVFILAMCGDGSDGEDYGPGL